MLLHLDSVSKQYPAPAGTTSVAVLTAISLDVNEGDSLAIVGPSGSGKSTLLNIMGALDLPSQGSVSFRGQSMSSLSDPELATIRNQHIGFIFQLHHLLPQCTVLENVLIPVLPSGPAASDKIEKARSLLSDVGLADRTTHLPAHLSGGERQRVAVVRALINDPDILLADEPTGSLDSASAEQLADLLVALNTDRKIALVTVTHSQSLAARMQKRYRLTAGCLEPEK